VRLTHPDKVMWPDEQITKLDLARYYERLAPTILKYVRDRPLTLRPFPRGVDKPGFYRKDAPKGIPAWIETFRDVAESTGEPVDFVVARDERTIVWLAQFNSVEIHAWLATIHQPDHPDWAVVDLDPPDGLPEAQRNRMVVEASLAVRDALEERGLRAFAKRSGQSGVHLLVPLAPVHPFDTVRAWFEQLAKDVCRANPDLVTTEYGTEHRRGRILIDYAQNARGKTTVAPYSVRPQPGAPVSVPLTWEEIQDPNAFAGPWTIHTVPDRLARTGDVLEGALTLPQHLP
jgi:bifunctional non-homologous end joining protein LigD